jgi:hypothetical protein
MCWVAEQPPGFHSNLDGPGIRKPPPLALLRNAQPCITRLGGPSGQGPLGKGPLPPHKVGGTAFLRHH